MPIQRITKTRQPIDLLDDDQERAVCSPEPSELAARTFADMYNEQEWLLCECGVIYYIRQGVVPCRMPNQLLPEDGGCSFCQRYPYHASKPSSSTSGPVVVDPTLPIIRSLRRRTNGPKRDKRIRSGDSERGERALTTLGLLMHYMSEAGFTMLDGPVKEGEMWRRLLDVLAQYPLDPENPNGLNFSDLTWTPVSSDTPEERLDMVRQQWDSKYVPQVWVLGIVEGETVTKGGVITVDGRFGPVQMRLRSDQIKCTPQSKGPWLVIAAGALNSRGELQYGTAGLQAIVAPDDPVPVESSHERAVVLLLQQMGVRFYKPMRPLSDRLRPDFLIYRYRIFLEVQGVEDPKYDEEKAAQHAKLLAHPDSRGWRLITYDPRPRRNSAKQRPKADAYTLQKLRMLLRNWWRWSGRKGKADR